MSSADLINGYINAGVTDANLDTNKISDGYHTFGELYDHRITLFIALCRIYSIEMGGPVWKSKKHHDGSSYDGWFIMGIFKEKGKQISYHLPISRWDDINYCEELDAAPEWDGHTSNQVLERLKML